MKLEQITYPEQSVCKLLISATAEELEQETQAVYLAQRAELKIKGFERGEADRAQAEAVKGKDFFWYDATNNLIDAQTPAIYNAVVAEHQMQVVSECSYDLETICAEDGFVVAVSFCLLPHLTIGDYKNITVTQKSAIVTDAEVEQIVASQKQVKPELADAFRAKVREKLTESKANHVETQAKNSVLSALAELSQGEVPTPLVDQAYEAMLQQLNDLLQQQQMTMADFLERTGHTTEEFRADTRKGAERQVRTTLTLIQIGVENGFTPTPEEVEAEILVRAEQVKSRLKDFAAHADRRRVAQSMIRQKATKLVFEHATILKEDAV